MRFLLDTNIVSELRKGERCDPAVAAWSRHELLPGGACLSVLVIGEIEKGIARIGERDPAAAAGLQGWLTGLKRHYRQRLLPVTLEIASEWGRLNAGRPLPAVDSLLAATANVHGLVLATRNTDDLEGVPVQLVNPFNYRR